MCGDGVMDVMSQVNDRATGVCKCRSTCQHISDQQMAAAVEDVGRTALSMALLLQCRGNKTVTKHLRDCGRFTSSNPHLHA